MSSASYRTHFGSIDKFDKGGVQIIDGAVKHDAFSNSFEIATRAKPYERVVFGQNQIYVLEALRAEGSSPWYTCAHDEFALSMDGEVEIHLAATGRTWRQAPRPRRDENGRPRPAA